jgi:uncharacterized protein YprB with RNaseH-like and TPR domain
MNDLLSRLRSLGLIIPSSNINSKPKTQFPPFDSFYEGVWKSNNAGRVFFMEKTLPYRSEYGMVNFSKDFSPKTIINLSGNNLRKQVLLEEVVFLDIETTNLSTGAGSFAFLIGLCHFSSDGIQTNLLFIENPNDEPALLAFLDDELSKFTVISSYNGKSFDIPLLKNRYIMHRMPSKSINKMHIDLLHLSRKIWKSRIQNCRLSDIEREILKYTRSDEEIPGWLIPQIYFDYLDQKSPQLLEGVFYHNRIDVLSLAALFQHITTIIECHETMQDIEGIDLTSLARIYQQLDQRDFAAAFYKLGVKKGIDDSNAAVVYRNFGFLFKKQHEWENAVYHWKLAAKFDDIESCIELAKYYEHIERSFNQALDWTNNAEILFDRICINLTENKLKQDIIHRRKRLIRRVKEIG